MYEYNATIINVVDGDTFDADVDVGFYLRTRLRFRVLGINAPEMHGPSHDVGVKAKLFAQSLLLHEQVIIQTVKTDVFGRWLAKITFSDGSDFGTKMLQSGNAVPFSGK